MRRKGDFSGKRKMRTVCMSVENEITKETYLIGLKHNMPRKAFEMLIEMFVKRSKPEDIVTDRLLFIINESPILFNYRAELLDDKEKENAKKELNFKNDISWK